MKPIRKLSLAVGVGAIATLAVIAVRHAPAPSQATRPHQTEHSLIAATSSTTTPPANRASTRAVPVLAATNWDQEFRISKDQFSLIARAAKAAINGDGRAAYYVSLNELNCLLLAQMYGSAPNPDEKFNEEMASSKGQLPTSVIENKREQLRACAGFFKVDDPKGNDVFADLPPRDGGYRSNRYWMDLAYQAGDPLAEMYRAATDIGLALMNPAANSAVLTKAQADINQAIVSGEPEAIFRTGIIVSDGRIGEPIQGFAFMLAACDLGYSCTADHNNSFPFGECVAFGNCPPGETVADWVAKNTSAEGYAQAYARAQEIKAALAQGDTGTLQKFAQLKGS